MDSDRICMGCMKEVGFVEKCPYCNWVEGTAPDSLLHLPPRTLLQNKYIIGRVLGQGGFGITYLAWDSLLDRKLAIKEYFPRDLVARAGSDYLVTVHSRSCDEQFNYGLHKFLDEAKTLAKFDNHPNIIAVKDFFTANGTAYLVMNYLEGCTLKDYLLYKGIALTFDEALAVILPILDALETIHEAGMLHRDISPDNVFITAQGSSILLDFGAARHALGEKNKNLSIVLKPGYAPEEQYRSKGIQGPWTDIYAVAATFYHATTGVMPQESLDRVAVDQLIPPSQIGAVISPGAENALLKALSVYAESRYKTIREFHDAILVGDASAADDPIELNQVKGVVASNQPAPHCPAMPKDHDQPAQVINIGRHTTNDLVLTDHGASRFHATVFHQSNNWYLIDRDSTCGTFLNDQRVEGASILSPNSIIRISDTILTFDGAALVTSNGHKFYAKSNGVFAYDTGNGLEPTDSSTQGEHRAISAKAKLPYFYVGISGAALVLIGFLIFSQLDESSVPQASGDKETIHSQEQELVYGTIDYNGGVYTGELKSGKPHGHGVWVYKETSEALSFGAISSSGEQIYEGQWQDGKKHGKGRMTLPTGLILSGTWENGVYMRSSSE